MQEGFGVFLSEVRMTNEIEANLPEAKYVKKWKKKVEGSEISIYLKVKLPHSHWERRKASNLQKLLKKYQVPMNYHKNSFFDEVICSGNSEETGKYTLISYSSFWSKDIITLRASRKGEGVGKLPDLVAVVQKYVNKYKN